MPQKTPKTTREREDAIQHELEEMRDTLSAIAYEECTYYDMDRPSPCDCAPCRARSTLRRARKGQWRYEGARSVRATNGHNPRETRIVESCAAQVDDGMLAMILSNDTDKTRPTTRDWYVIMSVVQWLATNVGMCVLRSAGWKYTKFEEDREARDNRED